MRVFSRSFATPAILSALMLTNPCAASDTSQDTNQPDVTENKPTAVSLEESFVLVRSFEDLKKLAKQQSKSEHVPEPELTESLAKLDYDEYIKIQYRHDQATWAHQGLPFWLETFHRGFVQRDRVHLFTLSRPPATVAPSSTESLRSDSDDEVQGSIDESVEQKMVCQRLRFSSDDFKYPESIDPQAIGNVGHAGMRVVGRFPGNDSPEEILSFLGSSYFRARSSDTIYGSSARGIAIDIALQKVEEFPDFRAFWIEMPGSEDECITVLGFLDGPSVCGAYRFVLHPGTNQTDIEIECELNFRKVPEKVGIAPLTSMWIWGDGLQGPPLDARPSVHDSDGLLIWKGGDDWRWRPYARQDFPSVTSVHVDSLHGFGTLQRNRAFYHYDDHNARYDKRPSVWVTPKSPWTGGRVELLELPGAHEGIDNIGAYWVTDAEVDIDTPLQLEYTVSFFAGDPSIKTKVARATNLKVTRSEGLAEIEIRFAGPAVKQLDEDAELEIKTSAIRGKITSQSIKRTETGDWVLTSIVDPDESGPVELSWTLVYEDESVSEEVAYLLPNELPTFTYPAVYTRQE
ncbi:glucan biosynthesis protein [Stieleria sp. JC731]|uniref:glucan biosynthesis protein n=1 Tax=Pirellulaceae TaxID=2691357 RepID=UPI001E5DF700|nr:glucan biosynthesis protein [Stieleria sp. JC731]MCC9603572.1 glucan biosynthesis protein [Stieleria sp. JC731]